MAKFQVRAGAEVDVLTKGELDDSLSKLAALWAERARGIRYVRRTFQPQAATYVVRGPAQGFAWNVKLAAARFSAADSLQVLLGEAALWPLYGGTPGNAGTTATIDAVTWGSDQLILNPGEVITVQSAGGATMSELLVAAIEIPAERLALILS